MRRRTRYRLSIAGAALLVGLGMGCGLRQNYVVETLTVERLGWDTLTVDVGFTLRSGFGSPEPVVPERHIVYVFGAGFDTLYAGVGPGISIPDARLGDQERILLEVCGRFGASSVCEQTAMAASPKRFRVEDEIDYPERLDYLRGRYALQVALERQQYEGEDWETIDPGAPLTGYLLAYVGGQEKPVKIPFERHRGRFNMIQYAHYKDFRYFLNMLLLDQQRADVHFDVFVRFRGEDVKVAAIEKEVRLKTQEERVHEISAFVEQAVAQVLDRLDVDDQETQHYAFINDWGFSRLKQTYEAEVEVSWQPGRRRRDWHEVVGVLSVRADGSSPTFRQVRANRPARRRWEDHVQGDVMALRSLE